MRSDLVSIDRLVFRQCLRAALLVLLGSGCGAEPGPDGPAGATRVFLWFADGGDPPVAGAPCAGRRPPAYECAFGESVDDCRRQVLALLDRWYADFNVVFSMSPGGAQQSVVITTSGDWCDQLPSTGGLAPVLCEPAEAATVYAFQCGRDAHTCASIIAQEHAHTIGLAHTGSPSDVMFPGVGPGSDGFEPRENAVSGSACRPTQNSHALMGARLGRWSGGRKPSPLD
jgi:hypothetical protein